MLEQTALFVSNLLALADGDPYEGHFPDSQVSLFEALRAMPIATARSAMGLPASMNDDSVRQLIEIEYQTVTNGFNLRGGIYVNCWHMNESESDAMWRLYSLQGQGIAVQSTYDRLTRSLHMTHSLVQVGEVDYADYSNHNIRRDNVFHPALSKRSSFAHERELRIAILNTERNYRSAIAQGVSHADALRGRQVPDGYAIDVDLDILIERVVISPRSPSWVVDLVRSLLRRYGLSKPVVWSPLYALNRGLPFQPR
jgi:hypothetical protein